MYSKDNIYVQLKKKNVGGYVTSKQSNVYRKKSSWVNSNSF